MGIDAVSLCLPLLMESKLMLYRQAGPVCMSLSPVQHVRHELISILANVFLPKDRISMAHQGFGFCEFLSEQDSDYAVKIMNQIKLYGKPIRVNKASYDRKQVDVGANLFIGSLDEGVDEAQLYETFSTFGHIADQPKVSLIYSSLFYLIICCSLIMS